MDKKHIDENEDVDKYGEFVCSYFAWLQPSSQKEKANKKKKGIHPFFYSSFFEASFFK